MRPPPGATPPQMARTSPPHADLRTNNSSRGRIGRNTMAGAGVGSAAAAGLAAEALAGALLVAGAAGFVADGLAAVLGALGAIVVFVAAGVEADDDGAD